MTADLDYVAIPSNVVSLIEKSWKAELKDKSGKAVW
jgi:phosphate transport system substrate-binding protein